MVLGACADQPFSITAPDGRAGQSVSGAPSELGKALLARFTVDVAVTGALRPGQPVGLRVTARGVFPTADVEVRLMLPEVAAAKVSSWNEVVIPIGTPLPAEALWRTALAQERALHVKLRSAFQGRAITWWSPASSRNRVSPT